MAMVPANIVDLMEAEKRLSSPVGRHFRPSKLRADAPLTIAEETVGGFELRARVSKQFIDRDAMMQLEFATSGRSRLELYRCEWRPFGFHTNKAWGPPGFELARFHQQSHSHQFDDNWVDAEQNARRGQPSRCATD